jgi:hypothetical protein
MVYSPHSFVVVLRIALVALFVAVTVVPGKTLSIGNSSNDVCRVNLS